MTPTREHPCGTRRFSVTAVLLALAIGAAPANGSTPTPVATPASPTATRATTSAATGTAVALVATATAAPTATRRPSGRPTPLATSAAEIEPPQPTEAAAPAPIATSFAVRPRAFRTPEREVPPAFVAPEAAPPLEAPSAPAQDAPAAGMPPARSTAALIVFRVAARTALEGFDLRVAYPRTLGSFASNGQAADCNAGTGTLVAASDRGDGELRLLVASAQALPLPLDVFCRFTVTSGAGLDPRAFEVRVAEVTSDGKRADPSLLIVDMVVR